MTTNISPIIKNLKTKPGLYVAYDRRGVFFIEVDPTGTIYQLRPHTRERDGELSDDGWINLPIFYGPLLRPSTQDTVKSVDVLEAADGNWLAVLSDNTQHTFPTEVEARAFQRGYRVALGCDPMTGELSHV
jgi:hypothetical protein